MVFNLLHFFSTSYFSVYSFDIFCRVKPKTDVNENNLADEEDKLRLASATNSLLKLSTCLYYRSLQVGAFVWQQPRFNFCDVCEKRLLPHSAIRKQKCWRCTERLQKSLQCDELLRQEWVDSKPVTNTGFTQAVSVACNPLHL